MTHDPQQKPLTTEEFWAKVTALSAIDRSAELVQALADAQREIAELCSQRDSQAEEHARLAGMLEDGVPCDEHCDLAGIQAWVEPY